MVCWHTAHIMNEVVMGLHMSISIQSWNLFHAWSKEKSRMSLLDSLNAMRTVEKAENTDAESKCGGGGGQLYWRT